jgi:hypothetical protein
LSTSFPGTNGDSSDRLALCWAAHGGGAPARLALRPASNTALPEGLWMHQLRVHGEQRCVPLAVARAGDALDVVVAGRLTSSDRNLLRTAALGGTGLACALENGVEDHMATERPGRVLEHSCQAFSGF